MTTQDQKDKKIAAAEKTADAVRAKLTKAEDRIRALEADYAETRLASEHLEWVKEMPVSGRASGEVGAIETPAADAE